MCGYNSSEERLRADLRDYFGTAMFNGNPMAMMELEEVERASGEELRRMAPRVGIDPARYDDAPLRRAPRGASFAGSLGVGVSTRAQYVGPAATSFFDTPAAETDGSSFFAQYARTLCAQVLDESRAQSCDNAPSDAV